MSSLSRVLVEEIRNVEKHPNADTLSLYELSNGYTVIHKTDTFKVGERVAYVPVDMKAPESPEYDYLDKYRVRGKKIRGIISCGLALPLADQSTPLDTDLTEAYGFVPYESPAPSRPGSNLGKSSEVKAPLSMSKYDIESVRKYHKVFQPEIVVTEKIHGAWFGALYNSANSTFYVKSRGRWLADDGQSVWSLAARSNFIEKKCRSAPDIMFCGEVFGWVADLRYGAKPGELFLAMFDAFDTKRGAYLDYDKMKELYDGLDIPRVPEIYRGHWLGLEHIANLAERTTLVGNDPTQIAEGVVIKTVREGWNPSIGRIILKYPSNQYLTRA